MRTMTTAQYFTRMAALAALAPILLVACTGAAATGAGSASTKPSSSPTVSAAPVATSSFTSPVYGYTVSYPTGWVVAGARTVWTHGKNSQADPGVSDIFQSPGKARVEIAVQNVPAGWSAARWESDFLSNPAPAQMAACYPRPQQWAAVTIAGHPGGLLGRVSWCGFTEGVVVIGQRAYVIKGVVDPNTLTADTFDMGVLHQMFGSLTPTSS